MSIGIIPEDAAALAEAQGCLDRLVAAFGPDLPAFGGRSAADDIERERTRRRTGPGTSGGDPVQRWATERDGAHRAFGFVERFRSQELSYLLGMPADLAWTRVRTDVAMPADLPASTEQAEAAYELAWKGVAGAPEGRAEAWRRVTDVYQALESLGSSSLASAGASCSPCTGRSVRRSPS
ncbi:hypothetical protein [Streptomyces adonidis]|uniref:hypothetical protein n=1 Tax=Streptomyces adonidis TaxID=3231367 RepID=UPI0034DB3BA8